MNSRIAQVALTLSSGRGSHSSVIFSQGSPTAPFSVGKSGDWRVHARGVEAIHLYLCFDGERAYVAAASEQARVFVPGAQVGRSWLPLVVPSRLWFGTACLVIQAQSSDARGTASQRPLRVFAAGTVRLPDFSQADEPQTRILDLAAAGLRKTQRFETPESMLALLREAGARPQSTPPEPPAAKTEAGARSNAAPASKELPERAEPASSRAGHATTVLDLATARTVPSFEPVPVGTTTVIFSSPTAAPSAPAALTSTLYDGGRLRDYAARLAANAPAQTEAEASAHSAASSRAESASNSQPPVVLSRRSSKTKPTRLALALRVGGLCLGLLGVAAVWTRQQSAKANPSLPRAAVPAGSALSAAAPAAAAQPAPPSPPQSRAIPAVPSASAASAVAALNIPALSPAHSDRSPSPSAASSPSAAPLAAPSSNLAQPAASAGATQAAPDNADLAGTEHAAFAAAFSGNDSSAAALYAKLAADSHSRTFELAARLAREGHIRKP